MKEFLLIAALSFFSVGVLAQQKQPILTNEAERINAEELLSNMDNTVVLSSVNPGSSVQIILTPSRNKPTGSIFILQRMFNRYSYAYADLRKVYSNVVCVSEEKQSVKCYVVPKDVPKVECEPYDYKIEQTTLFETIRYSEMISDCCAIENWDKTAAIEFLEIYAEHLKKNPDFNAVIHLYLTEEKKGKRIVKRDSRNVATTIGKEIAKQMKAYGIEKERLKIIFVGYKTMGRYLDLWLVHKGDKAPKPKPNPDGWIYH